MQATQKVTPFAVPAQFPHIVEPITEDELAESIDESVEFGDVSAETREMVEADFFACLRGGVA